MPSAKIAYFLDSNVLIYAATAKTSDPRKFQISRDLILGATFGVSGQTLSEFCSVVRKKNLLASESLREWLRFLGVMPLVPVDQDYVLAGLEVANRYELSYYDAALLAAAARLGTSIFYTEDLNHGQLYGSVRALNPFLEH